MMIFQKKLFPNVPLSMILFFSWMVILIGGCQEKKGHHSDKEVHSDSFCTAEGCTSAQAQPGLFLDSAVGGIHYQSGNLSGITDPQGKFEFEPKATVQFVIGDIVLGTATAQAVMTPVNLVSGATSAEHPTVLNLARFLQTLDDDGDPSNGITISSKVYEAAKGKTVVFNTSEADFEGKVSALIQTLTSLTTVGDRPLIPREKALEHLKNTLNHLPSSAPGGKAEVKALMASFRTLIKDSFLGTESELDGLTKELVLVQQELAGVPDLTLANTLLLRVLEKTYSRILVDSTGQLLVPTGLQGFHIPVGNQIFC